MLLFGEDLKMSALSKDYTVQSVEIRRRARAASASEQNSAPGGVDGMGREAARQLTNG